MSDHRTHHVTTDDGVTIGATVHGHGPPLVFFQGAVGDGDLDWQRAVGHLADRYTCHLPSQRGRGLSGDHPELTTSRFIDDAVAYVDSIGEPVGLTGWSGGSYFALGVAVNRPDAVTALAPFEPGVLSLMDGAQQASVDEIIGRTAELASGSDLAAAVRTFLTFPFNDREIGVADDAGYVEAAARYAPKLLSQLQQAMQPDGVTPVEDPAVLGTISAPVVVLLGTGTKPFFTASAKHVVSHVPNGRIHEIPGAGHAAPLTHPEALAEAITEVLSTVRPA